MQTEMFSCVWSYSLRGEDPGKTGKGRERRCVWEKKRYVVTGTNSQKMQKERNEVITERALKLVLLWWEGEREEKLEGETQGFGEKQGRRWGSSWPLILISHSSWRWDGRLQCGSWDSAVNGMKRLYAKAVNLETKHWLVHSERLISAEFMLTSRFVAQLSLEQLESSRAEKPAFGLAYPLFPNAALNFFSVP